MSRFLLVWLNSSLTDPYWPLFEIIYAGELLLIFSFLLLLPLALHVIHKHAELHQNVRLLLSSILLHGSLGAVARLPLIAHQLLGDSTDGQLQLSLNI
ncbi:hypothetical protein PMAYCL1PPCAC_11319, partial [Pristionchus mayeri]